MISALIFRNWAMRRSMDAQAGVLGANMKMDNMLASPSNPAQALNTENRIMFGKISDETQGKALDLMADDAEKFLKDDIKRSFSVLG